ncbi:MAG: hypothetical protein ACP5D2_01950 [Candidatus Nanoarchaeia archaeon]
MAWQSNIGDVLQDWADMGIFDFVLPAILIFAVIYAILEKTNLLGENKGVSVMIAAASGLLALQLGFVQEFFTELFPRFGMAIAVLVVAVILIGFFHEGEEKGQMKWIGYVLGIGVVIWALTSWDIWGASDIGIGWWLRDNFWNLIIAAGLIGLIVWMVKSGSGNKNKGSS